MTVHNKNEQKPIRLGEVLEELDFTNSTFEQRQEHIKNMLARYLNLRTVVALVGSGASIPLGYPSWTKFALQILKKASGFVTDKDYSGTTTIKNYLGYLQNGRGNELSAQVMLGECERIWSEYLLRETDKGKKLKSFRDTIKVSFDNCHKKFHKKVRVNGKDMTHEAKLDSKQNPYLALLKLPIRRFITTNYDLEIERALLIEGKVPCSGLKKDENACADDIIRCFKGKSFSQDKKYCDELAKFPLARFEINEYTVFHCHGRIDEVETCIVTEKDYQQWYLKDDPAALPFRQALELTLSSNPILIIGYGLGDVDLMRWLRMITANRPEDRVRNPLFCINYISRTMYVERWGSSDELIHAECDALYQKYGLHVIPVFEPDGHAADEENALCRALSEIAERWTDWWDGLSLKPKFRATPTGNFRENAYYHYQLDFKKSTQPIPSIHTKMKVQLENRIDALENRPGLAVVVGDGGAGKSWSVQKYLEAKEEEYKDGEFIFWSSYYANDVLTGIDRLIEFLMRRQDNVTDKESISDQEPKTDSNEAAEDRFEKLIRLLREPTRKHVVIVFDGVEKLLTPDSGKTDGKSISPEVQAFFRVISENYHAGKKATEDAEKKAPGDSEQGEWKHTNAPFSASIILTTRLFPLDILPPLDREQTKEENRVLQQEMRKEIEIIASRCWTEDLLGDERGTIFEGKPVELEGVDTFKNLYAEDESKREKISALCSLVDGHVFCIALIRGVLEIDEEDIKSGVSAESKFDELERKISNTPIDRRIYRVIREAIEDLDAKQRYADDGGIVQAFVERISLFMHPVRKEVAKVCYQEAAKKLNLPQSGDVQIEAKLSKLLSDLVEKNLLQQVILKIVKKGEPGQNEPGYVVHPLVRNFVHQTLHKSLFTSVPSLQLSGITTMEVVDPGTLETGVDVTQTLFETLCEDAVRPYRDLKEGERPSEEQKRISSDLCRGAFSILRSRFSANTVTRWGDYAKYLQLVVKLYDTAKVVSEERWMHHEPTPNGINMTRSPKDKPAPLYADEVAWVYNEIGLTSISMGHVLNAIPFREQGLEISRLIDNDRDGRYLFQSEFNLSTAYMFLGRLNYSMEYLRKAFVIGNRLRDEELISRAKAYIGYIKYLQGSLEEADKDFNDCYSGIENNPRARGVFYCYHSEILLKLGRDDEAKVKIDQSRHIGVAEFYPDLIAYARLAKANLLVRKKKYDEAQNEYSFVLKEAKRTRLRRLQTGALSGMSRLAYRLNDTEVAKQRAVESLKISNEYALCLHQTIGMIVLGKALLKEGVQRDLGIACLKTARDMANSQGYFLRKNEAEQLLQELKVE
jgi:tetratricopeptide (TPR) repeat protein